MPTTPHQCCNQIQPNGKSVETFHRTSYVCTAIMLYYRHESIGHLIKQHKDVIRVAWCDDRLHKHPSRTLTPHSNAPLSAISWTLLTFQLNTKTKRLVWFDWMKTDLELHRLHKRGVDRPGINRITVTGLGDEASALQLSWTNDIRNGSFEFGMPREVEFLWCCILIKNKRTQRHCSRRWRSHPPQPQSDGESRD